MSLSASTSASASMSTANFFTDKLGSFLQLNFTRKIKTKNEIIFVVDISGSMEGVFDYYGRQTGNPIGEVNKVLTDIQMKNPKLNHKVITYNQWANVMPLSTYLVRKPIPSGMTYFSEAFNSMKKELGGENKTFIFMTDGEDTSKNEVALKKSMTEFKLTANAYASKFEVAVHVIGFGNVKSDFLNNVITMGNFEGKFRYASESKELVSTFNDIFDYCENTVNCELIINGKSYQVNATPLIGDTSTSGGNQFTIELLLPPDVNLSECKTLNLKSGMTMVEYNIKPFDKVNPLLRLKSLELRTPNSEADVLDLLKEVNGLHPKGLVAQQRIELEQIRRELNAQLLSYLKIFNSIKGQILDEESKLKLKNLRSETNFVKARRQRTMEVRINTNITHMQKLDSELAHIKSSITPQEYKELESIGDEWQCLLSLSNIHDIMKNDDNIDDFLCLGILVERDEIAIDSPTTGLKLKSISSTVISYNSFIDAMNNAIVNRGANYAHGGFTSKTKAERHNINFDRKQDPDQNLDDDDDNKVDIDDVYCVVGQAREHINAVIPLYIHEAHYRKVNALKKCWLGYLYTLDSRGYDKYQESGLLSILGSFICKYDGTSSCKKYLTEFSKICKNIMDNNKELFTEEKYQTFINSVSNRARQYYPNLVTPLAIGYLRGYKSLEETILPVYWEYMKRSVRDSYSNNKIEAHKMAYKLLYGDGDSDSNSNRNKNKDKSPIHVKIEKMEMNFFEYFYNPDKISPPKIILDDGTKDNTSILHIVPTTDVETIIADLLPSMPKFLSLFITNISKISKDNPIYSCDLTNTELCRKYLLLSYYYYNDYPSNDVNENNVMEMINTKFQMDKDNEDKNNLRDDTNQKIANVIVKCEDISSYGGMLRIYCNTRCSQIFFRVVDGLIRHQCRDKLIALLSNEINDTKIYTALKHLWLPMGGDDIRKITDIVGSKKMKEIEDNHKKNGSTCGHIYRESDKPNSHGHCNSTPWTDHNQLFKGYNYHY